MRDFNSLIIEMELQNYINEKVKRITNEIHRLFPTLEYIDVKLEVDYEEEEQDEEDDDDNIYFGKER